MWGYRDRSWGQENDFRVTGIVCGVAGIAVGARKMILESQGSQLGYREMILESQGSYVGLQGSQLEPGK